MSFFVDTEWVNIGRGNERWPPQARLIRQQTGMVIGRVIKAKPYAQPYVSEVFQRGDWVQVGLHNEFDAAVKKVMLLVWDQSQQPRPGS